MKNSKIIYGILLASLALNFFLAGVLPPKYCAPTRPGRLGRRTGLTWKRPGMLWVMTIS